LIKKQWGDVGGQRGILQFIVYNELLGKNIALLDMDKALAFCSTWLKGLLKDFISYSLLLP